MTVTGMPALSAIAAVVPGYSTSADVPCAASPGGSTSERAPEVGDAARRRTPLLAGVSGQIDGVLIHEGARRRIAFIAGWSDVKSQLGVGVRAPGG